MPGHNDIGFLDDFGVSRAEFGGVSLSQTERAMIGLAKFFAEKARERLVDVDRIAEGALEKSIIVLAPQVMGRTITVEVEALSYYKYVNSGVAGTKGGTSTGGFAFSNKGPNVDALLKWLKKEGSKVADPTKNKVSISTRESKRQKMVNQDKDLSRAKFISKRIKEKGLKPTHFWTDSVEDLRKVVKDRLGAALKLDTTETIKDAVQ